MLELLTVEETIALCALYDAETYLLKAMAQIPSGDGPVLPPELMTVVRARQYIGKQINQALINPEHWDDGSILSSTGRENAMHEAEERDTAIALKTAAREGWCSPEPDAVDIPVAPLEVE